MHLPYLFLNHYLTSLLREPSSGPKWEACLVVRRLSLSNKALKGVWDKYAIDHPDRARLIDRFALRTAVVEKSDQDVYDRLDERGLLTDECGREWYMRHLQGHDLYYALLYAGLLTADLGRQWHVDHAPPNMSKLYTLRHFGLLTAECGQGRGECCADCDPNCKANWYARHLRSYDVLTALRGAGLLTADLGLPFICRYLCDNDFVSIMTEANIPFPEDMEWYINNLELHVAHDAMEHLGMITADVGVEWYLKNIDSANYLLDFLQTAGLLTGDRGRDWYVEHFGCFANNVPFLDALRISGLLTADCGRDWYAEHFGGRLLVNALEESGLLTAECGREWYARHFHGDDLQTALEKAGLLTPDCGRDWYARHFEGWGLYSVLDEADLLTPECGRDWYVDHLGEVAYFALETAGLLTDLDERPTSD